ncbi:MAG: Eco57I restriction-modification methylase domain-containing protein [Promethearchaeota archaeon]
MGVVITPPKTAEYMISRLGQIKKEQKILDPCVGPGIFIKKLLELGIDKNQIFAFDINPNFRPEIEKVGVSFTLNDTLLSLYPDSYNEFDFIVGNPPYLNKASWYIKKNRLKLRRIYGKINAHETYAMFIVNSIWRLKEGGKLVFITSDSFLTLSTHKKLRKFILRNCIINEILLAPKNLFSTQKVSTSPVIICLTKYTGHKNKTIRENNIIKVIPRINSENDYLTPNIMNEIKQLRYHSLPFNIFFINVEEQVIKLFEEAPRLEDYIQGYIGMHTHNNRKFIAAVRGTKLANIFNKKNEQISNVNRKYKIIDREDLESEQWKPYLKRGGAEQYYRPIMEALDWSKTSISIYDIPQNVPFESEGIVISGVSSRLAARYMPKGCYWDSNKAIGCTITDDSISIEYVLGVLNSSLYNYLAKGIINNTNSIQITGIHALPFILPDNNSKRKVEKLVRNIINNKKNNTEYDYKNDQKEIDEIIFDLYAKKFGFTNKLKKKIESKYSI